MAPAEPTVGPGDSRPQERRPRKCRTPPTLLSSPNDIHSIKPDYAKDRVIPQLIALNAAHPEATPSQDIAALCASPCFSVSELETAVTGMKAIMAALEDGIERREIRDDIEDEMHREINVMKRKLDTQHEEFVREKRRQADEMVEKRWQERAKRRQADEKRWQERAKRRQADEMIYVAEETRQEQWKPSHGNPRVLLVRGPLADPQVNPLP